MLEEENGREGLPGEQTVVKCLNCRDVVLAVRTERGVEPLRSGESCVCGAEMFRALAPSEVANLPDYHLLEPR